MNPCIDARAPGESQDLGLGRKSAKGFRQILAKEDLSFAVDRFLECAAKIAWTNVKSSGLKIL